VQLQTLTDRLDAELRTAAYAELDASANGLQIGPTTEPREIDHVAFAVDAVEATATAAAAAGADLLVTHHGVVWGGLDRAAGVADLLELESREPFGSLGPEHVGQIGVVPEPYRTDELAGLLGRALDHGGEGVQVLDFGPAEIERIAVLTGSGSDWLDEAVAADADALVTGEAKGKLYHEAREAGITVFLGGHYATETFGVAALADLVADWGVETTVIDHPTGL
jgi:putative NIF3 family GTP cyclohydrolase 1 type 2